MFQPFEEFPVTQQPVFHGLGIACGQLAWRQGLEGVGVGDDQAGLIEGADQILAMG